ncbi:MAG: hypothetical protein KKB90_10385 [Actinobacteria bacterium]|nr:hypothetical protein [Actinomycetota bacterium]MCG2819860.1 hypothetical protein [Actinomycetes bacterium]MBU4219354.1 hypothetical protein [Actinomycetota bacterium]MBU4359759.1 hypothetical protein [Actinomycetota bacterium]MBU4392386.1 hypothetical protein [Actinomycetota bacterium]
MRKVLAVVLLALMISAALVCAGCGEKEESKTPEKVTRETPPEEVADEPEETAPAEEFVQEQFTFRSCINFVRVEPSNNQLLTTPVETVTAYFSHDLGGGSFIEVTRDGITVVDGPMVIAPDLRSVSVKVKADRTGNYKVAFTPYYPSGYYETGKSGFSVVLDN